MNTRLKVTLYLVLAILLIGACSSKSKTTDTPTTNGSGLANPASVNCEQKGGKLEIQTRGDGGQYGVCVFAENRQCEEWALFRGECPEGGIDVSGYATEAAVYCAISGGEYTVTTNSGTADEQGTCTLQDATTCDALDFFNGKCPANQ